MNTPIRRPAGLFVALILLASCVRPDGGLVVESVPAGATLVLGEEAVGRTPVRITPLRSGPRELLLSLEGYQDLRATVEVPPNEVIVLRRELRPAVELPGGALYEIRTPDGSGYIDRSGVEVVAPEYLEARPFSEGLGALRTERGFRFVDSAGGLRFQKDVQDVGPFSEGLAFALRPVGRASGATAVYFNVAGDSILAGNWSEGSEFREGVALIRGADGERFVMDRAGRRLPVEHGISGGEPPSDGLLLLRDELGEGRFYRIQRGAAPDERELIDAFGRGFVEARAFSEGLAFVVDREGPAYIDTDGRVVMRPPGSGHRSFFEGLARFVDPATGLMGFLDATGAIAIAPTFELAGSFSDGRAPIAVGGVWGYIDRAGRTVIAPRWDGVLPFRDGLARVFSGDREEDYMTSYIDRDGNTIWSAGGVGARP